MVNVCLDDFEEKASKILEENAWGYYRSGAGDENALHANREAFRKLRIRPRFLRDVSNLDLTTTIFGTKLQWPVGIAPTAMQKMAHEDGEAGNARAAGTMGSVFIKSTLSTMSIEEVGIGAPDTYKWYQLYIYKDRNLTEQLVRRAEKANFKALVLTIDAPVFGQRRADVRNNFKLPSNLRLANFQGLQSDGVHSRLGTSGINVYVASQFDSSLTWKDVEWLVKLTKLPVIVKGVLTREDALLAREYGCAGVIVSNHGGRQLDYVPSSIEVLPEIADAVGNDLVVMLDGGVRTGNDVFKAIALGAKLVFLGRPAVWGLACNGQNGVEEMLQILKKDLLVTMKLTGCQQLSEIRRDMVVHESAYARL